MANELIKMKTGTIAKLEQETSGAPTVALDRGTIYFAVDTENHKGKIVYDAPVGTAGVDRIVMSTDSEYADYAGEAAKTTGITGIYPVKGTQTQATNLWAGTITGVTELIDGLTIAYYLPYAGTSTAATLQLNFADNGTYSESVPIYYTGTTALTTQYAAGSTIILTYWATENKWSRADYNTNDNTIGYRLRTNSTIMPVSDTARYYKLYFTSADNTKWVPASVNSTNDATSARAVNQRPINPFGRIVYTSANTNYTAGTDLAATTIWDQYNIVLGYSFNTTGKTLTLTSKLPVYIQCTLQNDGSAIIDATTPYVQTLPQTETPNKIYIFLGIATSATAVELFKDHPVYWFKGGRIRQYTDINEVNGTESGLMSASDKAKFDDGLTIAGNTIPIGGSLTATNLRTSLGLSNAMHFIGIATVAITDGSTTNPTISGYDFGTNGVNAQKGDVVIDKDSVYEYVWTGTKWEKLGPDSYGLSISDHTVTIVPGGLTTSVTIPDNNTWNKVSTSQDGYINKLSGNANQYLNGNGQWSTPPNDNDNTTYGLSISGHTVSLVEGGTTASVTIPDDNTWNANTVSQAGYVSAPGTTNANKVWKTNASGEPGWRDDANTTYSLATNTNLGLLKPWYNHTKASTGPTAGSDATAIAVNTISTTAGKYYAVESDSNGRLFVNVPWTDNNTWNKVSTTQDGYITKLPGNTTTFLRGDGSWATPQDTTYSTATSSALGLVKLGSDTKQTIAAQAVTTTENRTYSVQLNNSNQMVVNVPWVDNNTDTKQNIVLGTTNKAFITGVTTTPTSTATAMTGIADTGVYLTTTAGELNATQYKVNEAVTLQYNSTTKSLDFIFA